MDPGDPDEPSREELESRVEQLEETVSKMLPDRRGVIKGLGAAAIGAGVASSGASGQSAAGQVGTASDPVDVEGAQGNFDSVNSGEVYSASSVSELESQVNDGINYVRLDPSVSSFSSTIVIDPSSWGEQERHIRIEIPGTIEFTGTGTAIEITENASMSYKGDIDLILGELVGPGNSSGVYGVTCDEFTGLTVDYARIRGFQRGVYATCGDTQAESLGVIGEKITDCTRCLSLHPGSATGPSFKNLEVNTVLTAKAGGVGFWNGGIEIPQSDIRLTVFLPDSAATGWICDVVNAPGARGSQLQYNVDGNSGGTAINIQSLSVTFPLAILTFGHGGTEFADPNNNPFLHYRTTNEFGLKWYDRGTQLIQMKNNGSIRLFEAGAGIEALDASDGNFYRIRVNNGSVEAQGPL